MICFARVRLVHTIASLLVVLTTLGGVPQAFARAAKSCDLCSGRYSLGSGVLEASRPPARAAASRERLRAGMATVGRSVPFLPGVLPGDTALPSLSLSGTPAGAIDASRTTVLLSSSAVRGPPAAI